MKTKTIHITLIVLLAITAIIIQSCKKDNPNNPTPPNNESPSSNSTNISTNTNLSWTCTDPDGDVLVYDIFFGTIKDPTKVEEYYTSTTYDPGTLTENTTYYWKINAFEVDNNDNKSESQVWQFTTNEGSGNIGNFNDPRDGKSYATVEIGNQTWFAENLNYQTSNSWWYDNNTTNGDIYGRLYTWEEALTACPNGWHLPADSEWKQMEMSLGMSQNEADNTYWRGTDQGKQMKSTSGWHDEGNGTNNSGFNALPGGVCGNNGHFFLLEEETYFWSSTEDGSSAWRRNLYYGNDKVYRSSHPLENGFSVRCLKD